MWGEAIRFAQIRDGSSVIPIAVVDAGLADLRPIGIVDLLWLIESGEPGLQEVRRAVAGSALPILADGEGVVWCPPLTRTPRNVFCVGANYVEHVEEGQHAAAGVGSEPTIFTKPWTCLTGSGEPVDIQSQATSQVDWEGEVAFIIGKGGRDIAPSDALEHVFGFTLANDVSARDLQKNGGFSRPQWFKGKSLDGFLPLGPYLVIGDTAELVSSIDFEVLLNGHRVQQASLTQLHFDIPTIISYLSSGMELLPGDVVLTGTPSGVGVFRDPPRFLGSGDTITVRSSVLGELTTPFVDQTK